MAKKAKDATLKTSTTKEAAKTRTQEQPSEDRAALNDKARFDYGIMNAEAMSVEQLKKEMKAIDDQAKVGQRENAAAEKANAQPTNSNAQGPEA